MPFAVAWDMKRKNFNIKNDEKLRIFSFKFWPSSLLV
jgi:hypothetical protein